MTQTFFDEFAVEFGMGRLQEAAKRFGYPSAIYLGKETLVFHEPQDFVRAFVAYRTLLLELDYGLTEVVITEIAPKRGPNQVIAVDWFHKDKSGLLIEKSTIKYFCNDSSNDGFRIRLAEYVDDPDVFWSVAHQGATYNKSQFA